MTQPVLPIRPLVIGVTGPIACGKSTVLQMLADLGAETLDADLVYRDLIAPDMPLTRTLSEHFGPEVVDASGAIDRGKLGARVFSDPSRLADLDRLTHPAVIEEVRARIAASGAEVMAFDAVKLIESGMDAMCDQIWVVTCDPEEQLDRLMARNGLDQEAAMQRIAAQPKPGSQLARADVIIENSGGLAETAAQVQVAWQSLPGGG